MYSGAYSARTLPGADRASVHVAFPLPSGNVQVFLRPTARSDGSLELVSGAGPVGADGAYVVVDGGVLRTDHVLALWAATAVRLRYRLIRIAD